MATWYVRPDTSHSGTRDGTSYATAWGGIGEVVWGASGAYGANNDTLYFCGFHVFGAVTALGAHGGTDATHKLNVRGDYPASPGAIALTAGLFYFSVNRSWTNFTNIVFNSGDNRCVAFAGVVVGVTFTAVTFNGTGLPCVEYLSTTAWNFTTTAFYYCTFNGGGGGGGAAIHWAPPVTSANFIAGLIIAFNTFNNCNATRGVLDFHAAGLAGGTAPNAATKISDLDIHDNIFTNCTAVMIEAYGPEIFGNNTGLRIYRNKIYGQRLGSTGLGGAFSLGGFGNSLTADFGPNLIYANEAYGLVGPTGFCNPMYGSYIIFYNYAEDISTTTIDGCGILFDYGANGCLAFGNTFKRITGTGNPDFQSGAGIGIIRSATNIRAFGNIIDGCVMGIWYANQDSGTNSSVHNNHLLNCSLAGINGNATTFGADSHLARNNILSTHKATVPPVRYLSGAWAGETNNAFVGFQAAGTQAIHATSDTIDPILDVLYRPTLAAAKRKGTYLGGKDRYGKQFYNPPNRGAVEDISIAQRNVLRRPS